MSRIAFMGAPAIGVGRNVRSVLGRSCLLPKRPAYVARGRSSHRGILCMAEQKTESEDETKGAKSNDSAQSKKGQTSKYWPNEWVCVDCGYIYRPGRKIKFEDLPGSWKCPQCQAPKRRFAKKAGDYIAETAGTSNLPIIIFSIVGLLLIVVFGIWASTQL